MPVTLNASTSSGFIATSDTSGVLELQNNGTTRMTVNSSGVSFAAQPLIGGTAPPAFSAFRSANTTVSANTFVKVALNSEEFDTANCYDPTTNYRFTPNVAGYYQLNWMVGFGNLPTRAFTALYKNGADFKRGTDSGAAFNGAGGSALVYLNGSTDYVELYMYTNNGSANNLLGSANITYFQGVLVRGA